MIDSNFDDLAAARTVFAEWSAAVAEARDGRGGPGGSPTARSDRHRADVQPELLRYTDPEGNVFILDKAFAVRSVTDVNGNTLTISQTGITHSAGKNVCFTRDAQGRITQVTDPAGGVYAYDANGDLTSVTDRENNVTRFEYRNVPTVTHYLERILDPQGIQGLRTEYAAAGNPVQMTHDLAARRETIRDRLSEGL